MKNPSSAHSHPKPRRLRRLAAAYLAYFTAVCASLAAAAAVVSETVPLVVGGL